ncbi:MAG: hypothetical protein AAB448_01100 [Patescibacteria group bacterium]
MRLAPTFLASSLLLLGVGCTNPLAVSEKAATDILMSSGTGMILEETTAGLDNPFTTEDVTSVTVTTWDPALIELTWKKIAQQETEASKTARESAFNSPVGSGVPVPEVQYEEMTLEGTIRADGGENGTHLEVPSVWEQGAIDLSGEGNSLLWLSRGQYESLVTTRHATVTIGGIDSLLATLGSYYEQASGLVDKLQGNETSAPTEADVSSLTTLSADADWGSYELIYNGEKVEVQTITAENTFAKFEILANAENPLVLSVVPRPASWVTIALETLHADAALEGYEVTQISPSSVDQPQPLVQ